MADFPAPGESVGRYTVGERIGQGGSGSVFRATRSRPRREVALKVIPSGLATAPGFREHFLHEADVLAELNSPHIVAIHDVGEEDGYLFIATDLIAGGDLGTRLARGPVPLDPALTLVSQMALALAAAHQSGIIHGDVKPTNVLLGQRDGLPHAYLCDFGIAQPAGAGGTRRNLVTGTYAYLAPEVITGGAASAASDIYALGCLLVAVITGTPPYQGTDQEIAQQHLTSEIPHWEETSPLLVQLNELIRTALAKDPADRYSSAEAFRSAILAVSSEVPEETAPETEPAADPEPAVEAEPDESVEETQIRMAPVTVPVFTPDEPEPTDPAPPKRSGRVLISSLAALVLVGAAVGGIVLFQNKDDGNDKDKDTSGAVSSTSPSASITPSSSPTPGQKKTCQDGHQVDATVRCGQPYGIRGLRFVFSGISGDCTEDRLATETKYWEIACDLGGQNPATVTYTTYRTTPIGRAVNDELFPDEPPVKLPNGMLQFGPEQTPSGRWQVGLSYTEKHPYGVLIVADSRQDALRIADATAATALAPEDFRDD